MKIVPMYVTSDRRILFNSFGVFLSCYYCKMVFWVHFGPILSEKWHFPAQKYQHHNLICYYSP